MQPQTQKLVKLMGGAFRGSNTGYMNDIMFSIKNRKFIKGFRKGRCNWYIHYRLFPATYLRFTLRHWSRQKPTDSVTVELVRVRENGSVVVLKSALWRFNYTLTDVNELPEIVRDFALARPAYHGPPTIDFSKIYSEDAVNEVLAYLKEQGSEIVIGAEHE